MKLRISASLFSGSYAEMVLSSSSLNKKVLCQFFVGFLIGSFVSILILQNNLTQITDKRQLTVNHNENLTQRLYDEVKVLCLVLTHPSNHKSRAIHVKNTWGRRCQKLLFITSQPDSNLDTIVVNVTKDTRNALRNKTRDSFLYVHDYYLNDFDWFMKADDDNFIVMENLLHMLSQYNPNTALLFGHRAKDNKYKSVAEGYPSGSGYILSRKALQKMVTKIRRNFTEFFYPDGAHEDLNIGKVLQHSAIFVDTRDEKRQNRFFPVEMKYFFNNVRRHWYWRVTYYHILKNIDLACCSDKAIAFHYINLHQQYFLEYLIYHVQPFGLRSDQEEALPRKLSLREIINASDADSPGKFFIRHEIYHQLDSDEMY